MNIKPYLLCTLIITALPCVSVAEQSERCAANHKASAERCAANHKASAERCAANQKASAERCAANHKASAERCAANQKASAKLSAASQKANANACVASQKANANACVASQKANANACAASQKTNAEACAASSSTLSINISWWPDAPLNFLKGIINHYIGGFFEYKEYVEVGGEAAENAAPALKDLVNRATKGTTLHHGAAMDKAWEICVENHPNADTETLLNCVNPY